MWEEELFKGNKLHLFCLIWLSLRLVPMQARWGCRGRGEGDTFPNVKRLAKALNSDNWGFQYLLSLLLWKEGGGRKRKETMYLQWKKPLSWQSGAKIWPLIPSLLASNLGLSPFTIFKTIPGYNSELKLNFRPWWFPHVALTDGTFTESSTSIEQEHSGSFCFQGPCTCLKEIRHKKEVRSNNTI